MNHPTTTRPRAPLAPRASRAAALLAAAALAATALAPRAALAQRSDEQRRDEQRAGEGSGDRSGDAAQADPGAPPPSGAGASTAAATTQSAPPPPAPPPAASPPERATPEEDGDGRAVDILWIEAGLGWSYVDLVMLRHDNFLPSAEQLGDSGPTFTVAAGFRLSFLTIGARASLASYLGAEVGTLVADVALRIPIPTFEPYIRGGFGYGWVGDADYDVPGMSETSVYGLAGEVGAGLDIYLDKIFAIGAGFDAAFLNLSRQRLDMCSSASDPMCMLDEVNFSEDGDALGVQMRIHGHASLHF